MAGQPRIASYFFQRLRVVCLFCAVLFGSVCPVQADLTKALEEAGSANPTRCKLDLFDHQIDVWADFIDRFGCPPPAPSYIAISADSDDTGIKFSA